MIEFRVLGPLEARDENGPIALGGSKQRALVAILLLNANEVVSADHLIDELWGERPPKTAAKSLQVLVSQLRKAIEPERAGGEAATLLVTRPPGYALEIAPAQLDLERFQRLVREGRDAATAAKPQEAAERFSEALALWRGRPLADMSYAEFAQREIARLEELRLAVLEDRIEAELACGRHAELIGELEGLVADEPLRERLRALLMLALYRSGRQAEALETYRGARQALTEELGIEPGRELKELHEAILRQDPMLELASMPQPAKPPAKSPPLGEGAPDERSAEMKPGQSFVGRERELREFVAAFADALAGRTSLFLIAGEPGIGKSRLADELASRAQERGAKVCWGRCWEAGGAPAYWPWVQALRTYIRDGDDERIREALAPGAADIAQMLPELHELFPDLPPPPSLDPEGARFRLFDSLAAFLRAAGRNQPIVLVLDDLHAADKPSLLLLQFLVRALRDARLVLVAAYRDTEPSRDDALRETVAEARREPVTRATRLGGLEIAEVARVIEQIGETRPTEALAGAVHRETEGNPLFVGELVRLLASEGRLEEVARSPWKPSIPQGVREVIGHRLRHLSEECKGVLSVASVLGREFGLDTLERLSGHPRAQLLRLLDEAERAQVVLDRPAELGGLRFSHALIRDSLYDDLPTSERLELHRRAADALEELYDADSEAHLAELAYHSYEAAPAGDVERAVEYAGRAGERAAELLAYEEAARLYRMGLEALELRKPRDEAARCDLLLALGDAQNRGGSVPASMETFVQAAEVARALDEPERLARAALGYGGRWIWFRAGKDKRLIPLLEDALAALPDGDSQLRATLLARLAGALRDHPVPQRREQLTAEALAIARRLGDPHTVAIAVGGTYSAMSWPQDIDAWLEMANELVRLGDELGDKEQAFFGHWHRFGVQMVKGEMRTADREYQSMVELAQELRQPSQTWVTSLEEASMNLLAGRLQEAETAMERAFELGRDAQGLDATYWYVVNVQGWAVRREQGRLAEILATLEEYVEEHPGVFIFRCLLASVYAELGREEEARRELDRLAADHFADLEVGTEWFLGACVLAEVCWILDDAERAQPLYEALLPFAAMNAYAHPEAALGVAARPLGVLAAMLGRWDESERHFELALELNARMGARPWVAHTRHEYARMLIRRGAEGDEARASELLRLAAGEYEELGMTSWREQAEAEL